MQDGIERLISHKGKDSDKQNHPLFIAFAGPGQGKSRLLTEFPALVEQCMKKLKDKRGFTEQPLALLLTCENGMAPGDWTTQELNAQRFVACRMLWQLREANKQIFHDVGAPTDFAQFRAQCSKDLVPAAVLQTLLTEDESKSATVVIGIDGMQNLPGFDLRGTENGKGQPFYQVMREVCRLIDQTAHPFVVACVTATQDVSQALADSPQSRIFLKIPRVTQVTVNGVDQIPDNNLKKLLVKDMGGHGRALECLVEALNDFPAADGSGVMGAIMQKLNQKYPDVGALGNEDIKMLLVAALAGKWIPKGVLLGGVDAEKAQLVRLLYSNDWKEYRIDLPYIWLHKMLSKHTVTGDLKQWRLIDYDAFAKPPPPDGTEWESFNADFRVLRSLAFEDKQPIEIRSLHRGAIIQPDSLHKARIINRHLKVARTSTRSASKSSCCGNPKPTTDSNASLPGVGMQPHQCKAIQNEHDVTVTMPDKNVLLVNAKGAPAADAVLMVEEVACGGNRDISECLQMKHGNSQTDVDKERNKACDDHDILVMLCNAEHAPPSGNKHGVVFVALQQFDEYYGPYAGRAFNTANRCD